MARTERPRQITTRISPSTPPADMSPRPPGQHDRQFLQLRPAGGGHCLWPARRRPRRSDISRPHTRASKNSGLQAGWCRRHRGRRVQSRRRVDHRRRSHSMRYSAIRVRRRRSLTPNTNDLPKPLSPVWPAGGIRCHRLGKHPCAHFQPNAPPGPGQQPRLHPPRSDP